MRYGRTITRRTNRLGWMLAMVVFVGLLVVLYFVKTHTLAAKTRVHALEQTLIHEKQVVRILAAEIAHLESPERLRVLADTQLDLLPTPVLRTLTLSEAARKFAKKPNTVPEAASKAAPKAVYGLEAGGGQ